MPFRIWRRISWPLLRGWWGGRKVGRDDVARPNLGDYLTLPSVIGKYCNIKDVAYQAIL